MTSIDTSNSTSKSRPRTDRRRTARPERIDLGNGVTAVRNDLEAANQGASERAVNRDDAKGAPFLYIAGVKYRPQPAYSEYLQTKIQRKNQRRRRDR